MSFDEYMQCVREVATREGFRSDFYVGEDSIFRELHRSGIPAEFAIGEALAAEDF